MPKRKYTAEFKESAVKLVNERGYTVPEAAKSRGSMRPRSVVGSRSFLPAAMRLPAVRARSRPRSAACGKRTSGFCSKVRF
jgi:hypothetical protein